MPLTCQRFSLCGIVVVFYFPRNIYSYKMNLKYDSNIKKNLEDTEVMERIERLQTVEDLLQYIDTSVNAENSDDLFLLFDSDLVNHKLKELDLSIYKIISSGFELPKLEAGLLMLRNQDLMTSYFTRLRPKRESEEFNMLSILLEIGRRGGDWTSERLSIYLIGILKGCGNEGALLSGTIICETIMNYQLYLPESLEDGETMTGWSEDVTPDTIRKYIYDKGFSSLRLILLFDPFLSVLSNQEDFELVVEDWDTLFIILLYNSGSTILKSLRNIITPRRFCNILEEVWRENRRFIRAKIIKNELKYIVREADQKELQYLRECIEEILENEPQEKDVYLEMEKMLNK